MKKLIRIVINFFKKKPEHKPYVPPYKPNDSDVDLECNSYECQHRNNEVSDWTPLNYRTEYIEQWLTQEIKLRCGSNGCMASSTIDWTFDFIERNKERYIRAASLVFEKTGSRVPWQLIAAIHVREAGGYRNPFERNFLNGQLLSQRTTIIPKGYGPYSSWEDSVVDGFIIKFKAGVRPDKWTIANTLYFAERYNGMGYRTSARYPITGGSPYILAFTQHYKIGLFWEDGKFDKSKVAKGLGVMPILKHFDFRGVA